MKKQYVICESRDVPGEWRVEVIDMEHEGDCFVTLFSGPQARKRAAEYVNWITPIGSTITEVRK